MLGGGEGVTWKLALVLGAVVVGLILVSAWRFNSWLIGVGIVAVSAGLATLLMVALQWAVGP